MICDSALDKYLWKQQAARRRHPRRARGGGHGQARLAEIISGLSLSKLSEQTASDLPMEMVYVVQT